MITGYEEPVLFPSMNLYDTGMMQMYVNAAREQYNQNREDMANFLKEYGSFTSPISSDVTWVDQQTRGRVNDAINYLQQNGIDPLRSAEGRAVIQRVINSTDVAGINARRQSAENRKLWDKTAAALKAEGKYNADFVNWAFQQKYGVDPSQWSTAFNGIWQETSPEIYQDLNAATKTWYDQMQPGYLGTVDGYDYVGNTPEDVAAIAKQNLPDLTSTYWQYQKELARRQLGPDATEDQINGQLINNIVAAQAEKYMRPTRVENAEDKRASEYRYNVALDDVRTRNDIRANREKEDASYEYDILRAYDKNFNKKIDDDERELIAQGIETAVSSGGKKSGTKGSDTSDYLKYNMQSYVNGLTQLSGGSQDWSTTIKPNLGNLFTAAFEHAGYTREEVTRNGKKYYTYKSGNKSNKDKLGAVVSYVINNLQQDDSPDLFPSRLRRKAIESDITPNAVLLDRTQDPGRLVSSRTLVSSMYGSNMSPYKTSQSFKDNFKNTEYTWAMEPSGGKVISQLNKLDGRIHQYVKVRVFQLQNGTTSEEKGGTSYEMWYDLGNTSGKNDLRPGRSLSGLDIGNEYIDNAMTSSMSVNKYLGAKQTYKSEDPTN